ncbi:MAG: radical SAM protein [Deltaproteobacteria bacterium]|nr:radical SAM protein [Deltaproteobacteria bacterium]
MRSFEQRIETLGLAARHEQDCGAERGAERLAGGVYHSVAAGRRVSLLKVLQSTHCSGQCHYCAIRASRDVARAALSPDEMARHFLDLRRAGVVEGLFLSSGIHGRPDRAMERMIATAEVVRRSGFRGYVHLKILPGTSDAAVERAVTLADRVSVNLEAPTDAALARLSPGKQLEGQILGPLRSAARIARQQGKRAAVTTQFVVGAAGETDAELLGRATALYDERLVSRCYFSPFAPPADGPFAGMTPAPRLRMVRLYQADWLLRYYGFSLREIPLGPAGLLDQYSDPKTVWARGHPAEFPVEVNRAARAELLRVPGIGPAGADRIVRARRSARVRSPGDLGSLGVRWRVAAPYLTFDGRRFRSSVAQPELPGIEPRAGS